VFRRIVISIRPIVATIDWESASIKKNAQARSRLKTILVPAGTGAKFIKVRRKGNPSIMKLQQRSVINNPKHTDTDMIGSLTFPVKPHLDGAHLSVLLSRAMSNNVQHR